MEEIAKYLQGKGIDFSKDKHHAAAIAKGIENIYLEPNQLYSAKEISKAESLEFASSFFHLLDTKFYPVMMSEWLYLLKKGGHMVLRFSEDDPIKISRFKLDFALYLRHKVKLVYRLKQGLTYTYVFEKILENAYAEKSIDKWTFGILTLGTRNEWVEQMIDSIIRQKIPEFEIIICGKYDLKRKEPFIRFVPSNDHLPRVTKKKNDVCREAMYENICVLHDRVILDDGWFEGMLRFGNNWDYLGCIVTHQGTRSYDYFTTGAPVYMTEFDRNRGALLYDDWDPYAVTNAGIFNVKKSAWEKTGGWNELDHYPGNDDMIFCADLAANGFMPRFNPYSSANALSFHALDLIYHKYDAKKLGPLTGPAFEQAYWKMMFGLHDLFIKVKPLSGVKNNAIWRLASTTFKKARLKLLKKEYSNQSWSQKNKVDII